MHYHCELHLPEITNIDKQVEEAMKPFEEKYDEANERYVGLWDWWQIGGRYTGAHGNYEPSKDSRNFKKCWLCDGTGMRNDEVGKKAREDNPTYTCNGCGVFDQPSQTWKHSERGAGIALAWPTQWVRAEFVDVIPVESLKECSCYTLIVNGKAIERETWDEKNLIKNEFNGDAKKILESLGIKSGYLVTIDYHS